MAGSVSVGVGYGRGGRTIGRSRRSLASDAALWTPVVQALALRIDGAPD